MKNEKKYINEFLAYILSKEKESFLDNPFQTSDDKTKIIHSAEKKLKEITDKYLNEVKK